MDTTETHYLTFDSEAIYTEMLTAYMEAGGDVLYPGDEKEILLRAVQAIMIQALAGVDNALRMGTLRYAVGDYLDLIGEQRGCYRLEARAATARVHVQYIDRNLATRIPAGTAVTSDGKQIYKLANDVVYEGGPIWFSEATIIAEEAGTAGNNLNSGTRMQFLQNFDNVEKVYCSFPARGGTDREGDEAYRDRIREYGNAKLTTGPKEAYESAAKAVSAEILDARAMNGGAGNVNIYLILADEADEETIITAVQNSISPNNLRPLTDTVTVLKAEEKSYTLNVEYRGADGTEMQQALEDAVAKYHTWQDETIGKAFDPYYLVSLLYSAGATQVQFGAGSEFDDGTAEYTAIPENCRCTGKITLSRTTED